MHRIPPTSLTVMYLNSEEREKTRKSSIWLRVGFISWLYVAIVSLVMQQWLAMRPKSVTCEKERNHLQKVKSLQNRNCFLVRTETCSVCVERFRIIAHCHCPVKNANFISNLVFRLSIQSFKLQFSHILLTLGCPKKDSGSNAGESLLYPAHNKPLLVLSKQKEHKKKPKINILALMLNSNRELLSRVEALLQEPVPPEQVAQHCRPSQQQSQLRN